MKFENCKYDSVQLAAQFISMAEKFLPYAANESCKLNMMEPKVIIHECGTVACHGGYGLLVLQREVAYNNFHDGADAIADFLGFDYECELENWADAHPEIWGNNMGEIMFYCSEAFGVSEHCGATLVDIVSHYLSVAERLLDLPSKIIEAQP